MGLGSAAAVGFPAREAAFVSTVISRGAQQVTHGNVPRCHGISHAEPGQVALDRNIERDLARLNQLHHRQNGK